MIVSGGSSPESHFDNVILRMRYVLALPSDTSIDSRFGAGAWFLDLLPSSPSSLNGFSTALFVSFPAPGCAAGIGVNLYTIEECPMFAAETQYIAF